MYLGDEGLLAKDVLGEPLAEEVGRHRAGQNT